MNARPSIDATDARILDHLRRDGRRSFSDIGTQVNLSTSAVKRRVDRLERNGVISGYTVVLDQATLGRRLEAFAELRFSGTTNVDEMRQTVTSIPQVHALFMTAGDPDALVWLQVEDLDDLRRAIDALRRNDRVTGTKTSMVLGSWWRDRAHQATTAASPPAEHH